ncbi:uncharacterized protein LOC110062097 isoform X2 [Orbicella faveolata]|nr:uncharacterized protein LOC110062097 isoform X2 [Orbicella faveolata]
MTTPQEMSPIAMDTTPDRASTSRVKRRKRRVQKKIKCSKESTHTPPATLESESVPQVNFAENKEFKYLKEHLAPNKDPSVKAAIYMTYLANCDFNTTMAPNSIIQFDNDNVAELLSTEDNPDMAMQDAPYFLLQRSDSQRITFLWHFPSMFMSKFARE